MSGATRRQSTGWQERRASAWCVAAALGVASGCTAITGATDLRFADPDAGVDAGMDAAIDVGIDAGTDTGAPDAGPPPTLFPPRDLVCAPDAVPPCPTTVPLRSDEERSAIVSRSRESETRVFVLDALQFGQEIDGTILGLNLDGIHSGEGRTDSDATCAERRRDYEAATDPGHVGVDNATLGLVSSIESLLALDECPAGRDGCIDDRLAGHIADGSLVVLVIVRGLDDLRFDPEVEVELAFGVFQGSVSPARDASGATLPDQELAFVVSRATSTEADLFDRRLRARFDEVSDLLEDLALPILGGPLSPAELRATLDPAGALVDGVLAGAVTVDAIVDHVTETTPEAGEAALAIIQSLADLGPDADPSGACASLSMGMGFTAAPARLRRCAGDDDCGEGARHCVGVCDGGRRLCVVTPCPALPNALGGCRGGACELGACRTGFGDCTPASGCETSLYQASDCGACGVTCSAEETCEGGACACGSTRGVAGAGRACAEGTTCCGGACVDLATDETHCGACRTACDASADACCGGECTSLADDAANCGTCGLVCSGGQMCVSGDCG